MADEKKLLTHGYYIYKYVLHGEIIYIGKTAGNLASRLYHHGSKSDNIPSEFADDVNRADIYYIRLPTQIMMDVIETALINKYKPKYNRDDIYSWWEGLDFNEPRWQVYKRQFDNKGDYYGRLQKQLREAIAKNRALEREVTELREALSAKQLVPLVSSYAAINRLSYRHKSDGELAFRANCYCFSIEKKLYIYRADNGIVGVVYSMPGNHLSFMKTIKKSEYMLWEKGKRKTKRTANLLDMYFLGPDPAFEEICMEQAQAEMEELENDTERTEEIPGDAAVTP